MRPRIVVYVSADELAQMRREAARRRLSLSRYAKERLAPAPDQFDGDAQALNSSGLPLEKRLAEQVRNAFAARADNLADGDGHARSASAQYAHPFARDSCCPAQGTLRRGRAPPPRLAGASGGFV